MLPCNKVRDCLSFWSVHTWKLPYHLVHCRSAVGLVTDGYKAWILALELNLLKCLVLSISKEEASAASDVTGVTSHLNSAGGLNFSSVPFHATTVRLADKNRYLQPRQSSLAGPCSTPGDFPPIFSPVYPFKSNDCPDARLVVTSSPGVWACEMAELLWGYFQKSSFWYSSSLTHSKRTVSNPCPNRFPWTSLSSVYSCLDITWNMATFQVQHTIEFR